LLAATWAGLEGEVSPSATAGRAPHRPPLPPLLVVKHLLLESSMASSETKAQSSLVGVEAGMEAGSSMLGREKSNSSARASLSTIPFSCSVLTPVRTALLGFFPQANLQHLDIEEIRTIDLDYD